MATRNVVPRADGEGNIGTSVKNWLSAFFKTINLAGEAIMKQITTPSNPSATYNKIYFKSDDKIYKLTSAGVESEVGGTTSPLTTKGDIYVYGTGNDRLPIGTNGYLLVPDSTVALGVKWKAGAPGDVALGNVTNDAQIKSSDFPASSVDNEIALFSSTSGKVIKRASTTGLLKATSGVIAAATGGTDYPRISRATFVNGDLSTGVLTITHSWALSTNFSVSVVILDNNDKVIVPDEITCLTNTTTVDLSSFGTLSGTWKYLIIG